MDNTLFKELISKLPSGYALYQISPNDAHPTDYTFVDVNPAFELFTGLSAAELLGKRIHEIASYPKDDDFRWENFYADLLTDNVNRTKEITDLNAFVFNEVFLSPSLI